MSYLRMLSGIGRVAVCLAAMVWPIHAQGPPSSTGSGCVDDIVGVGAPGYQGHKFRFIRINVRYLAISTPPPGTPYNPETVTGLVEDVRNALKNEDNRESVGGATEFQLLNAVSVGRGNMEEVSGSGNVTTLRMITSCVKPVERDQCVAELGESNSRCVDASIDAITVRLDSAVPWANLLEIPRSNMPTAFSRVPRPLLALNPRFGADYDKRFGLSEVFDVSTNLLDLADTLHQKPLAVRKSRLDLKARGRKSLNERFYETDAKLALSHHFSGPVRQARIEAGFKGDHSALSKRDYVTNAGRFGGSLQFLPDLGPLGTVTVSAAYRRSSNRLSPEGTLNSERTRESAFEGRIISDGHLATGATRVAIWADRGAPDDFAGNYQRVAAMFGYQGEYPVGLNRCIGFEAAVGGGHAWGNVPQYARFYGGNTLASFLYQPPDSPELASPPIGPLIRSFGSGQAAVPANAGAALGGTSYWHANATISIPIGAWSKPLVPDIAIEGIPKRDANGKIVMDEEGAPVLESRPLKSLLKAQGESSLRVLQKIFVKQGLTPEQAQAKANRELKSIRSILAFIADQANLFSVKPLVMFDAARITTPGTALDHTRFGVGGGLQITIVVARFEAGYMRTVHRLPGDSKGNLFMRLVFQNLF